LSSTREHPGLRSGLHPGLSKQTPHTGRV
jgi:hypothetical protein